MTQILIIIAFVVNPLLALAHGDEAETIHDNLQKTIDSILVKNISKNCEALEDKDYSQIGKALLGEFITPETMEAATKSLRETEIDQLNIMSGLIGTGCFSARNWETLKNRIPGTIVAGSGKGKLIGAVILGLLAGIILGKVIGRKEV